MDGVMIVAALGAGLLGVLVGCAIQHIRYNSTIDRLLADRDAAVAELTSDRALQGQQDGERATRFRDLEGINKKLAGDLGRVCIERDEAREQRQEALAELDRLRPLAERGAKDQRQDDASNAKRREKRRIAREQREAAKAAAAVRVPAEVVPPRLTGRQRRRQAKQKAA